MDMREAMRYLGAADGPPELWAEVCAVGEALKEQLQPRWTYRRFSLERRPEGLCLPQAGLTLTGSMSQQMLKECDEAVVLVCTLGTAFNTLLRREQSRDMARAVILDACGSALVEEGCDAAQAELSALWPEKHQTDRFSPGYGDLPLAIQPRLCAAVDAFRRVGVSVGRSLLMNPCKSVSAIIGLADTPQPARIRGCKFCVMKDKCRYRKEGDHCGR